MTAKLYGFDRSFLHDTTERDPFVIDMVRADDYLKLEAQIAALQEQVRALAAECKAVYDHAIEEGYQFYPGGIEYTDAFIREIRAQARAEGIHFAANRLLAAWESGFVDDTPAAAHDISGAILSAVEFLPNADEAEFKRDYADEVRARIRAGEKS